MIKKEELLLLLKQSLETEEKAIPLYTYHLKNVLFLSNLSKDDQAKVRNMLEILDRESRGHKQLFSDLMEKIKRSEKDVY